MLADAGILKSGGPMCVFPMCVLRMSVFNLTKALALFSVALSLAAADQTPTQQMIARLSEEADAFRRIAPSLLGHETLEQKAHKPQPRFRPRVGKDAKAPPPVVWQDRQIVSEYGFAAFAGETETLHELRKVISVDGHPVNAKKGDSLAVDAVILEFA